MSEKNRVQARKTDLRVARTRDQLGDALVALMHEKPFDAIKVQEVLDRASVSRSTFYAHFRDIDDLFFSDAEDFFEMMATVLIRRGDTSHRIAPVTEMFTHVAEMRKFYDALVASGKVQDMLELGQGHFARAIEKRLASLKPAMEMTDVRRAALGVAFAGALFSLLTWWLDHGMPGTPEQMDVTFHQMVWSGIGPSNGHAVAASNVSAPRKKVFAHLRGEHPQVAKEPPRSTSQS